MGTARSARCIAMSGECKNAALQSTLNLRNVSMSSDNNRHVTAPVPMVFPAPDLSHCDKQRPNCHGLQGTAQAAACTYDGTSWMSSSSLLSSRHAALVITCLAIVPWQPLTGSRTACNMAAGDLAVSGPAHA